MTAFRAVLFVMLPAILTALLFTLSASPAFAKTEQYSHSVYFVRHFEKVTPSNQQVDRDPALTTVGERRALNLAGLLAQQPLKAIYSTQYKRTMQTALPTALAHNLTVTHYDPRKLEPFATALATLGHDALVVGHSYTTPYLVNVLTGQNISLSESDYGDVFVIRFSQMGKVIAFKTGRVNR
jgi:phosphohistidine phosphatase SixA